MKRMVCVATALVLVALVFGPAGAQSGNPAAPGQVMDDERMQQMMKMMQNMEEQMRGMQGRMQGMQGMGSMHGGMGDPRQGMMQQHREQVMGMQCPMGAPPPPR